VKTLREANSNRALAGKCLCGAVHYAVMDEFVYALNCHCSNCRRATGSAFKPFAGIGHVTMGTLVDDPTIRPTAHIFVGSKAPWFAITDHLPQHEELG
jgi:hypothetical protein